MRKEKTIGTIENLEIIDAGAEGMAVGRQDNKVVFVPFCVPGDIVDVRITRAKKSYIEGKVLELKNPSPFRQEPVCSHFGACGGCRWQNMIYEKQLFFKQKQVSDNLSRIGHMDISQIRTIIPSQTVFHYRNKLEYTFGARRWLKPDEVINTEEENNRNGLGFHIPGIYDKVIDLEQCYLQYEPSDAIRRFFREKTSEMGVSYYNPRSHTGFMRNLIVRTTTTGDYMILVVFGENREKEIKRLLEAASDAFPGCKSIMYCVNTKHNDTINDLEILHFSGESYLTEYMDDLEFRIGPVSFFQTNPRQALVMYRLIKELCNLKGVENVYDLYTGTGTIANFIARHAKKVTGLEYVPLAIEDAKENSRINNIQNTGFLCGDIAKTLNEELFSVHGSPDIIITDPPRAGMHPKVVEQIQNANPEKIIYISCNPSTQARDIAMLLPAYELKHIQPFDMFPHTSHVENVMLMEKRQDKTE